MALTLIKPWRTQPLGDVPINWNNPLTQGLVTAVLPYSSNSTFTVNRYTPFGVAGTLTRTLTVSDSDRLVSQGTLFGVLNYTGITFSIYETILVLYHITTWPTAQDRVLLSAAATATAEGAVIGNNSSTLSGDGRQIKTSGTFSTAITYPTGTGAGGLYENGKYQLSVPSAGTTRPFVTGKARIINAKSAYMLAAWDRQLSPRELAELSVNPYQIFRPLELSVPTYYPILSNLQAVRGNTSANLSTNVNY